MPSTLIILIVFLLAIIIAYKIGNKLGHYQRNKHWESQLPQQRQDAINRSRAVIGGQFSEQLAPYLPNFPYNPNECRFIGKPIDLIVFKGMDEKNITEIKFIEVKSGDSQLSKSEKPEDISKRVDKLLKKISNNSDDLWKSWLKLQPNRLTQDERKILNDYSSLLTFDTVSLYTYLILLSYYR